MMTVGGTVTGHLCPMKVTTATSRAAMAVATAAAAGTATRLWAPVTVIVTTGGRVRTAAGARRRGGGRTGEATSAPPRACVTHSTPAAPASSLLAVRPTCVRLASRRPRTGAL